MSEFKKLRKYYEEIGWEFKCEEWVNHHNGNDEYTWSFKSPRMKKFIETYSIMGEEGRNFDKEKLQKEELNNVLSNSPYTKVITNIANEISGYMTDELRKLYSSEYSPEPDLKYFEIVFTESLLNISNERFEELCKVEEEKNKADYSALDDYWF